MADYSFSNNRRDFRNDPRENDVMGYLPKSEGRNYTGEVKHADDKHDPKFAKEIQESYDQRVNSRRT